MADEQQIQRPVQQIQRQEQRSNSVRKELFKVLVIPLCSVVILLCIKEMSLSYVFAERVVDNQHRFGNNLIIKELDFRNKSQTLAEAIANINAMWAGLHAIGLYAAVIEDLCALWIFSTLETMSDILVVIYWMGGFYPLVLPDMFLLTLYFFLITIFSWVYTLTLI